MRDDDLLPTDAATPDEPSTTPGAFERLRHGAEAAAEPLVEGVGAALGVAASTVRELPGMRVRRIRRLGRVPLPSLTELYPESRQARPVVIGLRSIAVDDIRGTAVGGSDQRGGDFLPLRPFRGPNWSARWQRLRKAQDSLKILPPIDVVRFADSYWVIDGHNRVALALYSNQGDIDASVTELVPPGGRRTEPIVTLEAEVEAARPVRARTQTEPHIDPPVDPRLDRPDDPA
jgi:hypothetical protein